MALRNASVALRGSPFSFSGTPRLFCASASPSFSRVASRSVSLASPLSPFSANALPRFTRATFSLESIFSASRYASMASSVRLARWSASPRLKRSSASFGASSTAIEYWLMATSVSSSTRARRPRSERRDGLVQERARGLRVTRQPQRPTQRQPWRNQVRLHRHQLLQRLHRLLRLVQREEGRAQAVERIRVVRGRAQSGTLHRGGALQRGRVGRRRLGGEQLED